MNHAAALRLVIDPEFGAEQSAILRYARGLPVADLVRDRLFATSQREGLRLLDLQPYRGVRLGLLDETTCMQTGTYKSLDGCLTTAMCGSLGMTQVVFSSGANTGIALTDYAAGAGMETFFFCPENTLYKIDGALFDRPTAHLVAVQGPDREVKEAARLFADLTNLPIVPQASWRMLSAAFRCFFIAEQMLSHGRRFSWFSQAVCAAYGPIGIYRAFQQLTSAGQIDRHWVPAFLGVQQEGLCPIVSAWAERLSALPPAAPTAWSQGPIEPTLYNAHPAETYPMLCDLLSTYGGDMLAISATDVQRYGDAFTGMLREAGIEQTTISVDGTERFLENAGLMAGVGTLKAIEQGRIERGQTVLCALTGGAAPRPSRRACPEFRINSDIPLVEQVQTYAEELGGAWVSAEAERIVHHAD